MIPLYLVVSDFLASRARDNLRAGSVAWYRSKLRPIAAELVAFEMESVTRRHIEGIVELLPVSVSTKAAHYRACRAVWRWAKAQDPQLVTRDATEGINVTPRKTDSAGAEFLPVATVRAILANLPPSHQPAAALLFFAGIRPQELAGTGKPPMLWQSVDPVGRTIVVEANIAKTRSRRVLQCLPDTVWAWLGDCAGRTGPICPCSSAQLIRRIQQAGGFWRFSAPGRRNTLRVWPHDVTRHTFASYHVNAFNDPGLCALLMGHGGNPRMLYTHYLGSAPMAEAAKYWGVVP